ncbi:MAG: T9SS type A sorting domain-containing protein, partial [Bacteroidota bacterium]
DLLNFEMPALFNNLESMITFGQPVIDSLCGNFNTAFEDDSLSTCATSQIVRTFNLELADTTLADICEQRIDFRALGFQDITWPEFQIRFGCSDTFPVDINNHPAPSYTGYPFVYRGGVATPLNRTMLDDLVTTYADVETFRADGGVSIIRTWTVQDACRQRSRNFTQTIKLENNGLPFFSCPISNHYCPIVEEDIMLWATRFDDCLADIEIPLPELNNICDSANWTFITEILRLETNGDTTLFRSLEIDDSRLLVGVPTGDYLIRFIGMHPQEVIEDRYCRIRVADLSEPVTVCKSTINLSLPGSGEITVPLQIVNQGSYDNCGIDSFHIRRTLRDSMGWSDWQVGALLFDCADVGLELEVQLRAIDAAGNVNYCTSFITVKDNTEPYCTGLEPIFVSCDDLPDGFNAYDTMQLRLLWGMPEVIDNCSAEAIEFVPIVSGDNCSPERIRRRFQAIDQHGNLSTGLYIQDIHVTPSLSYAIRFPMDAETDCTDFYDTLQIVGTGCDSITFAMVDILLPTEGEECRYVQRNFVVTNWCEWDGLSPSIQIGRDENCSGQEGDSDVWLVRTDEGIFIDLDSLQNNNVPAAETLCSASNPEGYIRAVTDTPGGRYVYSQRFKVFDTTAPELNLTMLDTICVDTSFCRAEVVVGIEIMDACQIEDGSIIIGIDINNNGVVEGSSTDMGEITGSFPSYSFTNNLPIGTHRYIFTVTDDCGNTAETERVFTVNDCYVPFLTCRGDQIYNLQPLLEEGDIDNDGVIEEAAALVEAFDLARCDFLDCSGDLTYSVNRVGEPANRNQQSIFLDCEDRYQVLLEVYVWDDAFNPFAIQPDSTVGGPNWRSCEVLVRLQDPNLACSDCQVGDNLTVNGRVNSLSGVPLDDVTIITNDATTVTNNFGGYQLGGQVGDNFTLRATKDVDPRAGLTALDMVILQRHLLGIADLDDPFLRLAADLNRDGEVDLNDMITLRGLILGRREYYPTGSPWRFVAADWDGQGTPAEEIVLTELAACSFNHNFVGLRMGDLNDSFGADAGAREGGRSSDGAARPVALELQDQQLLPGETVAVTLKLPATASYTGGQGALLWNTAAIDLLDIEDQAITAGHIRQANGYLWMAWGERLQEPSLVTLYFRANVAGELKDYLKLGSPQAFAAEVYGEQLETHPLYLSWLESDQPVTPNDEGSQPQVLLEDSEQTSLGVIPNPARAAARVGVYLPRTQRVQIAISDLNGRIVQRQELTLNAGEQWLPIEVAPWPAGVYHFVLTSADGTLTERIVKN